MKEIQNFVDNIHNGAYLDAYQYPVFSASDWFIDGGREKISLDGQWHFSVDQYDNCLRARWYLEETENEEGRKVPLDYGFDDWDTITVPAVWNLQKPEYFYYEGPAVYCRRFSCIEEKSWGETAMDETEGEAAARQRVSGRRRFLRFGAAAYDARIFLNGRFLGVHHGASTPFCVEVTEVLKEENHLIVVVDNTRRKEQIPSENTDWFSYGGIFRSVSLMQVPQVFIKNVKVWLKDLESRTIGIKVELAGSKDGQWEWRKEKAKEKRIAVEIPDLSVKMSLCAENGKAEGEICCLGVKLWSPEKPHLYKVKFSLEDETGCVCDVVRDEIGFRTIQVSDGRILLNGQETFLRGVCLHEDTEERGRAVTEDDIREAFQKAKKLGCNFLRLAHYPHTELASRLADEMGLMLWEELPVYWWIDFDNPDTLGDGRNQLRELIQRDQNRASVIIWSVGNENPDTDSRYRFMKNLADYARNLDDTRLISAACLVNTAKLKIEDRLEASLDVIGLNEYYGWYDPDYGKLVKILENSRPGKPVLITEFGADGAAGIAEDDQVRGSQQEQVRIYENQIAMFKKTDYIQGTVPWILFDFRTPKRLGKYQRGYNIKGLVTADRKYEKPAFQVMQKFYMEKMGLAP